jgi:glycosyltransferase involved in cell wall biosynthesis
MMRESYPSLVVSHQEARPGIGASIPGRVTYVSWAESCSRSDHTARELGGRSHMVYAAGFGSRVATVLLKYLVQWCRTSRILRDERPHAIVVMTPPLFAALPAFWYAWRHGAQVALDAHSAAFLHPRWRAWQGVQRFLCRRAVTTFVHVESLARLVRNAGAHATLVPDVPVTFTDVEPFDRPEGFVVAVVCSFNPDEPVTEVFEAARLLPDVRFFMTGNPRRMPGHLRASLPPNLTLTGFLSVSRYGGLLAGADVVLALTTRDQTMLRAAYEAIYQGTPVVVSDWPVLREAFPEGAAYADNSARGIAQAVRRIQAEHDHARAGARRLRAVKLSRWTATRERIVERLSSPPSRGTNRC